MPPESGLGRNQLKALNALTMNQKISLLVLAVAVVAGISLMVYFMNQDEYQTLYSDLGAEEAGMVSEKLQAQKVPFRIGDSGKSIQVPAEKLNELRLQLASQGLPQGGKIGFEIFDQNNLGMTEFIERVSYKRALEGELARTILSLKEIGQVRVHLVLQKESLFQDKSEPTKASVVVKLKSGKQLSETMVSGMVHLVSSAVEGLTPTNVTVVDSDGRLLSGLSGTPEEALTGNQVELKARTEKALSARVVNLLEAVVGQGKVRADTSVVMDFSRSEQTEEKYDPMGAIRSQQKSEEHSEPAAGVAPVGVPGVKSNDANPPAFISTGKSATSFAKQDDFTNYEVSKVIRHTLEEVGGIKKLSVAVIVDDAPQTANAADGSAARKSVPRSPEDLKKFTELVVAAIGIDTTRGDHLTIENIAFDAQPEIVDAPAGFFQEWKSLVRPALRYGAFLLLFLMIYFFLIRPITKQIFAPAGVAVPASAEGEPERIAGTPTLSLATAKSVKEMEAELEPGNRALSSGRDTQRADMMKQRIAEIVQRDPEKGAQLVRAWLTEEGK